MGNGQSSRIRALQRELVEAQKSVKIEKEINKSIGLGLTLEHQACVAIGKQVEEAKKEIGKKDEEIKDLEKEVDIRRELQLHFEQENGVLKLEIARLECKMEYEAKLAKVFRGEEQTEDDDSKFWIYFNMKREMEAEEQEKKNN